jgi:hypothetical protein
MSSEQYLEVTNRAQWQNFFDPASSWIAKRTVAIAIGPQEPQRLGTGVIVELRGRTFLATVAHNFQSASSFDPADLKIVPSACLGASTVGELYQTLPLDLDQVQLLPSSEELQFEEITPVKDLAWLELDGASVARTGTIAVKNSEMVREATLRVDTLYAASGVPFKLMDVQTTNSRLVDYRARPFENCHVALGSYTHFNVPLSSDLTKTGQQVFRFPRLELNPRAELIESPAPHGMSGGGLWEVVLKDGQVACRLRGLIRARLDGKLLAIPIKEWLQFLGDSLPELSSEISSRDYDA